jgi:hypothetical protein
MRAVVGLLLALAFDSAAQAEDCKVIQDATARLACFDQTTKPVVPKKLPSASDPGLEKVRRLLLSNRARLFNDSDSVRDASSGRAFPCLGGGGDCVCLEVNAKNAYGGYTGIQTVLIKIGLNGIPENIGGGLGSDFPCGKMTPFPQLDGKQK